MSEPRELRTGVLIVGGGPVGLSLAVELGRRGVQCHLVERRSTPSPHPRAKLTNVRSMGLMRRWGIAEEVRDEAPLPRGFPSDVAFVTSLTGWELTRIPNALWGALEPDSPYPEPAQQIPQGRLETVLRRTAEALPSVTLHLGSQLESFEAGDQEVEALVRAVDEEGEDLLITASYLAGCDGGKSLVRETLEIEMEGNDNLADNFGGVIEAPTLWETHDKLPAVQYWVINAGAPGIVGPFDADRTWFFQLAEIGSLTDEESQAKFIASVGREVPCKVLATSPWRAQRLLATHYRSGRVFLLGDAAHVHPPMGGYGMNMGIGDAVDLGWKLAARVQGWGGDGLLDSYELERRPVHLRVIEEASSNHARNASRLHAPDLEAEGPAGDEIRAQVAANLKAEKAREFASLGVQLGYRYEDSPLITPDGSEATANEVETYVPTARPGHLLPHAWLGPGQSVYDQLGEHLTLLAVGDVDLSQAADVAARSPVPIEVVDLTGAGLRDLYEADLCLVRPDQHVSWRGSRPEDALAAALRSTAFEG